MHIIVRHSAFYDWEAMRGTPVDAQIEGLVAKQGEDGRWLRRVERVCPEGRDYTTVLLPEGEIGNLLEHCGRGHLLPGATGPVSLQTRGDVAAWYLERVTMPHCAPRASFTGIEVHDDPAVQDHLRNYFSLPNEVH
jgi:hypothetical protein